MSRSYQKYSMGLAHFRLFGSKTIKRDIHKKMRYRINKLQDEDNVPILPCQVKFMWPIGSMENWVGQREDFSWLVENKLPFLGRRVERIRKYSLAKDDIKFIHIWKAK